MENKELNKKDYWEGVPDALQHMCMVEGRDSDGYCTLPALKYLIDHIQDCESHIGWITPYRYMQWVDTVFQSCLFPLEHYQDEWVAYQDEITAILKHDEELLWKYAPADYQKGYRTEFDESYEVNIIEFSQKLDVYFCVLYMFTQDWENLEKRLGMLVEDTKRNMEHILFFREDADEPLLDHDYYYFLFPGPDKWEPINWLAREFLPPGRSRKLFVLAYEKYVLFLDGHYVINNTEAGAKLLQQAETILRRECDDVLDELEDELELCSEDDDSDETAVRSEMKQYEEIFSKSKERSRIANDRNSE